MSWLPYITMFLLGLVGLMLIFIILLQRGRGGGLAGALGGMGGTSAFGTRAGDVFTKITIGLAIVWTVLAAVNVWALGMNTTRFKGGTDPVVTAPALEAGAGDKAVEELLKDKATPEQPAADAKSGDEKPAEEKPAAESTTSATPDAAKPAESTEKPAEPK